MTCGSGVQLRVRSDSDWDVLQEIYIDCDYDDTIQAAFRVSSDPEIRVLDLGANVGFFSLRCIDLYRQAQMPKPLKIVALEGAPGTFTELESRVGACSGDGVSVVARQGLVGLRTGEGQIYTSPFVSNTNGVVPAGGKTSRIPVLGRHAEKSAYIDLLSLIPKAEPVDLVKCDIEGSELDFLHNYADLLRRTRFLVIEVHPRHCNAEECYQMLRSYGFQLIRDIRVYPTHRLSAYRGPCN
jgi:FkbM family methyltransferase